MLDRLHPVETRVQCLLELLSGICCVLLVMLYKYMSCIIFMALKTTEPSLFPLLLPLIPLLPFPPEGFGGKRFMPPLPFAQANTHIPVASLLPSPVSFV